MSFEKGLSKEKAKLNKNDTNLYLCKADIFLPRTQMPATRKDLHKILSPIDPGWKFIRIRDNQGSGLNLSDCYGNQEDNDETGVQTLGVILFLNEAQHQKVLGTIHSEKDIWQLRHTTTLVSNFDSRAVVGCMDFYKHSPDIPLFSICQKHFGGKVLRFNVFVKDFDAMKEYYERLTLLPCQFVRKGFCIFRVHSYPGLEVQISLKREMRTELRFTRSAVLRLKFREVNLGRFNLISTLEQLSPQVWRTTDPEGNVVILEEIGNGLRGRPAKRPSKSDATKDELVFV